MELDHLMTGRQDCRVDPVTVVVSALALGAAAGLKDTASAAVREAYTAVKALLLRRYKDVDVEPVERRPDSVAKRESLAEDLVAAGADTDPELLAAVRHLVERVNAEDPAVAPVVGVDIQRVHAAVLHIDLVEGSTVRVWDTTVSGDIKIGEVRAGRRPDRPQPR